MKVIIIGVPGVGKTSVANGMATAGWKLVVFGDLMLAEAKRKFGVADRDEMRSRINVTGYKRLQMAAARRIALMRGKVLVDTHGTILKEGWYYPGLPMKQLLAMKVDGLVVIEADEKDIKARRDRDKGKRKREGDILQHQQTNKEFAAAYAALAGIPVIYVANHEGKLAETIEAVKKACEHL
ncbi:MAG TPA: adenylate kinase [archaeon]|nr:adenylate kinase [archaeon]